MNWLSNPSFEKFEVTNESSKDVQPTTSHPTQSSHKKKRKKNDKKDRLERTDNKPSKQEETAVEVMEFDGTEDYYVDKKAERGYLAVQTLYKPACPK